MQVTHAFYSDRTSGPRPRDLEHIPDAAWRGLVALVDQRIESQWLAYEFPERCPDGNGVCDTAYSNLRDMLGALVPGMGLPLDRDNVPSIEAALDLVEFMAQRVAKPDEQSWHSYYRHYELSFDAAAGRSAFRVDINQLFARTGVAFELGPDMRVVRLGPPEARQVLADLTPDTGDVTLDSIIVDARSRYLSRHRGEARIGVEKLWDAFERLKTIEAGADKRAQVRTLLDNTASGPMRQVLEDEATTLTAIGNQMQIRHFETTKAPLTDDDVDYLFTRMSTLIVHVLRATGRLGN